MNIADQNIPNYLVQSILVTLFCCMPTGVVAIIFSSQVNSKLAIGDFEGAMEASRKAKLWCWVGFGIALASTIIGIAILAIFGLGIFGMIVGN